MVYMPASQVTGYKRSQRSIDTVRKVAQAPARTVRSLRVRVTAALLIMLICFGIGAVFHAVLGDNEVHAASLNKYEQIIVKPGDTLWSISEQRASASEDIRVYMKKLKKLNELASADLKAGQLLLLP
ncbi:MAG: hypothetical protein K0Q59_1613 [Paenibacillus sp.]|jgi:hypothetical protein|nr:hypothetical protein [Paenibacillus sp.]